jgi:methylated-DNA-[protein]-cysteine S-methyltransferase
VSPDDGASAIGFALFPTSIGACGIAWNAVGVTAVQLPEGRDDVTQARLARRTGASARRPPEDVTAVIRRIGALLEGGDDDLADVAVDLRGVGGFPRQVYEIARTVAPGSTTTYGDVAARLGQPGAARAVGRALGQNPLPIIVPCHRIVAATGGLGGFSARGGAATKRRMLAIEGAVPRSLF